MFRLSFVLAKIVNRFGFRLKIVKPIIIKDKSHLLLWKSIVSSGIVWAILALKKNIKVNYLLQSSYGQISSVLDWAAKIY